MKSKYTPIYATWEQIEPIVKELMKQNWRTLRLLKGPDPPKRNAV